MGESLVDRLCAGAGDGDEESKDDLGARRDKATLCVLRGSGRAGVSSFGVDKKQCNSADTEDPMFWV